MGVSVGGGDPSEGAGVLLMKVGVGGGDAAVVAAGVVEGAWVSEGGVKIAAVV